MYDHCLREPWTSGYENRDYCGDTDDQCAELCNWAAPSPPPPPFELTWWMITFISIGGLTACICLLGATRAVMRIHSRRQAEYEAKRPPPRQRSPSCSGKLPATSASSATSATVDDTRHEVLQSL